MHTLSCVGCSESFEAKSSRARWCSAACKKRAQRSPEGPARNVAKAVRRDIAKPEKSRGPRTARERLTCCECAALMQKHPESLPQGEARCAACRGLKTFADGSPKRTPCTACGKVMRRFPNSLPTEVIKCGDCRARPPAPCVGCGAKLQNRRQKRCGTCYTAHREASRSPGARRIIGSDGTPISDPRCSQAWRRLREQVLAEEPYCQLGLPGVCTTVSTTADHIVPVRRAPAMALDRTNVRGSCRECNETRRTVPDEALIKRPQGPPQIRRGVRGGLPKVLAPCTP